MDKALVKKLLNIHKQMTKARSNWDSHWQECALYVLPNKSDVYTWKTKSVGEEKHNHLFDGSPEHYNELLASALHSMLTNPVNQWFELTTGIPELDSKKENRLYLQNVTDLAHEYLNRSNFQQEVHEIYLDDTALGTSCLRMDEDDDTLIHFFSRPIYEVYIGENSKGFVDRLATEENFDVDVCFEKYSYEAFKEEAEKLKKDLSKKIKIVQMILPKYLLDLHGIPYQTTEKEFISFHIYKDKEILLREEGFYEFPYAVTRWLKVSGEMYGRSPTMKALPDIRMLNAMMKTVIRGAQKIVDPPLLVPDDGILGRVNLTAGGLTSYRSGTRDEVKPLLTGARPDIGQDLLLDLRNRIKEHYFIDQLQLRQGPQMTATEVNIRDDDRIRLLGPILGRFHAELLLPIVGRLLGIMKRRGKLPTNIPEDLQKTAPNIYYKSQIAKAQRAVLSADLNQFLGSVAPVLQLDPTNSDYIDYEQFIKLHARLRSVPESIIRSTDDVAQIRQQRQQMMDKQQQQQQNLADSQVVSNVSKAGE